MNKLKKQVESILLSAGRPVSAKEISKAVAQPVAEVEKSLSDLRDEYKKRGIRIVEKSQKYSVVSAPENTKVVSRFLNEEIQNNLSSSALESLAIIMYRQPITKAEIEEIKGTDCSHAIRVLNMRGLVEEKGRKKTLGRPILYGTTIKLLNYFGIESIDELPKVKTGKKGQKQLKIS